MCTGQVLSLFTDFAKYAKVLIDGASPDADNFR